MKFNVITIGSALLDIYLKSKEFKKISSGDFQGGVALCETYGGKSEVDDVVLTTGGGGTNTAVSFSKKDLNTAIICEMGTDSIAATIKRELELAKVNLSFIIEEADEKTGLSSIMVAPDGDRAVAVFRGASKMITKSDIKWDKLDTDWLYITSVGGQLELLEALFDHAIKKRIKVAWNPGKTEIVGLKQSQDLYHLLLSKTEVLILNRQEAENLTDIKFSDDSIWRSDHCLVGPRITLITDGSNGGKCCFEGKCSFWQADEDKVVEKTGAGDAFGSGFVSALIHNQNIATAIDWGNRQAGSVVRYMGPKQGLLTLAKISEKA
jgi:ribokinase